MKYGKAGMFPDSGHGAVVLLSRPFAATFSRQAQGTVGDSSLFSGRLDERDVRGGLAEGERGTKGRHKTSGRESDHPACRNTRGMGEKGAAK